MIFKSEQELDIKWTQLKYVNKFDTYSEIMPDFMYVLSCLIFEMSALSRYGEGMLAWIF